MSNMFKSRQLHQGVQEKSLTLPVRDCSSVSKVCICLRLTLTCVLASFNAAVFSVT